jgi:hypothetical protein
MEPELEPELEPETLLSKVRTGTETETVKNS